jgi:hypothetical protein
MNWQGWWCGEAREPSEAQQVVLVLLRSSARRRVHAAARWPIGHDYGIRQHVKAVQHCQMMLINSSFAVYAAALAQAACTVRISWWVVGSTSEDGRYCGEQHPAQRSEHVGH